MNSRILIIDSSEHYVDLIKVRLRNYGYDDCIAAKSGKEGLKKVLFGNPDLVIVATKLPDLDGFEVCRQMREMIGDKVRIILIAGMEEKNFVGRAIEMGSDDYIVKTFDCLQLMASIKRLLSRVEVA